MDISNFYEIVLRSIDIIISLAFLSYCLYEYNKRKFSFLTDFAWSFSIGIPGTIISLLYINSPVYELNYLVPVIRVIIFFAPATLLFARATSKYFGYDTCWICVFAVVSFSIIYLGKGHLFGLAVNAPVYMVLVGQGCIYFYLYKNTKDSTLKIVSIIASLTIIIVSLVYIAIPVSLKIPSEVIYNIIELVTRGVMAVTMTLTAIKWSKYKETGIAGILAILNDAESRLETMLTEES